MRPDMKDLLLNTGRHSGYGKSDSRRARFLHVDADLLPHRLTPALQYGYNRKSQGDRLAPLYKFLESRCGRPWNDVYSEICLAADPRGIRGFHLRQHVQQYVNLSNYDVGLRYSHGPFFVDRDGTLQKARKLTEAEYHAIWLANAKRFHWTMPKPEKPANPKIVDTADHWWEKVDGYWYEFTTIHTTQPCSQEDLVLVDGEVQIVRIELPDVHHAHTTKRQVNSKETKRLERLRAA